MNRTRPVASDATARHPFLAGLPPHIRRGAAQSAIKRPRFELDDLRDFLLAYCACFIAVSLFIA